MTICMWYTREALRVSTHLTRNACEILPDTTQTTLVDASNRLPHSPMQDDDDEGDPGDGSLGMFMAVPIRIISI